jgi:hypothetical protein
MIRSCVLSPGNSPGGKRAVASANVEWAYLAIHALPRGIDSAMPSSLTTIAKQPSAAKQPPGAPKEIFTRSAFFRKLRLPILVVDYERAINRGISDFFSKFSP